MRTIIVLHQSVEQNAGHGDGTTREVWVVVHAFSDFNSGRWVNVSSKQRKDIVLTTFRYEQQESEKKLTAAPCRAFTIKLRSGGRAPALDAREASSLG